jgi:hypothetical protein
MSASIHLGRYAEGWTNGDADLVLQVVTNDYMLDDPNAGKISKDNFIDYLNEMKETVKTLCNGCLPKPFMEITEVLISEENEITTAWCAWVIPGTNIKGAGLIKVNSSGVFSEVLTYYTTLA